MPLVARAVAVSGLHVLTELDDGVSPRDTLMGMMTRRFHTKWLIWGVGIAAYLLALINRSSFSALGPTAQEHFGAEATVLSSFLVLQLVVYALCQIPVGVSLDRFGTSWVIATGLLLMSVAQFALSTTDLIPVAIGARILLGAGDACIFTSVVRLAAEWFTRKQSPVVNQITGLAGQVGQLVAVAPLAAVIGAFGWLTGFASLAAIGVVILILVALIMRDGPGAGTIAERITGKNQEIATTPAPVVADTGPIILTEVLPVVGPGSSGVMPAIASLVKRPGVRLAFWVHFSTMFAPDSFLLLWGTPFLTGGLGYTDGQAHLVLDAAIVASMVGALVFGPIISKYSDHRVTLALGGVLTMFASWIVLIAWPGAAPLWVTMIVGVIMGAGIPLSMIAFDVVRTHAPRRQRGVATGLANMGGFTAALVTVLMVGVVLDLMGAGTPDTYSLGGFKAAMAVQFPLWIIGVIMILIEAPHARRYLRDRARPEG
ncbi:MFS transporter [Kocuria massiliensis]|uniref:MFS transporter n=1 Tax=Kocuria massiliensis TaxID=1926282 RepID=UPI0022B94755|nr:MFS transporter [Kocuria massiliensis]